MSSRDVRIMCPRPKQMTWGSSTCLRYFPSVRRFELTSVGFGVCRRLGYCDVLLKYDYPQTEKHDAIHTRHMNWTSAICIVQNITYCSNRKSWHQCLLLNYVWCKFNTIPCSVNVAPGGEKIRHPNTSKHLYLIHFFVRKVLKHGDCARTQVFHQRGLRT
jgi:hypothetical protein